MVRQRMECRLTDKLKDLPATHASNGLLTGSVQPKKSVSDRRPSLTRWIPQRTRDWLWIFSSYSCSSSLTPGSSPLKLRARFATRRDDSRYGEVSLRQVIWLAGVFLGIVSLANAEEKPPKPL